MARRSPLQSRDIQAAPTGRRPAVWINASDIYNRTAIPFHAGNLQRAVQRPSGTTQSRWPLPCLRRRCPWSSRPIVVQNYPGGCPTSLPEWAERVRNDPSAAPIMKSYAEALERYRSGEVKYVELLDGGLVDNLGLAGITVTRLANKTAYGPLEPEEAVKLRRLLFLVVDAGRAPSGAWAQNVAGPSGVDLDQCSLRHSNRIQCAKQLSVIPGDHEFLEGKALTNWRCHLSEAERRRYGAPANWNCRDVRIFH